jgi:hypothetical protein
MRSFYRIPIVVNFDSYRMAFRQKRMRHHAREADWAFEKRLAGRFVHDDDAALRGHLGLESVLDSARQARYHLEEVLNRSVPTYFRL